MGTTSTIAGGAAGAVAARVAQDVSGAAEVLYESGGNKLLPDVAKEIMRERLHDAASAIMSEHAKNGGAENAPPVIPLPPPPVACSNGGEGASCASATSMTAGAAARSVLAGVGRAAAVGAVLDGAIATSEAAYRCSRGTWDAKEAAVYVAGETVTGAGAAASGVGAAAGFVALTGDSSAAVVAVVAAATAIMTKTGLVWVWNYLRGDPPQD